MKTIVLSVNPDAPEPEPLKRAAEVLLQGGLVAFPTETVYGLGANALDEKAVARIYQAKGRPSHNPLILHVADKEQARHLVASWPEKAERLSLCWPGPLTLVLPRAAHVPDIVTGGGPTVGVRVPRHPVAWGLLNAARIPIAAPSANRSNRLSPTRAEHVLAGLDGRIDLLLEGGPCSGGLESTVIDLTTDPPRLLRPGLISLSELEEMIGHVDRPDAHQLAAPLPSPGLLDRHYAPSTPLELAVPEGTQRVRRYLDQGLRVGWITFSFPSPVPNLVPITMPTDPLAYGALLFSVLHDLDKKGLDRVVVDAPPPADSWLAVNDRLRRASESPLAV